MDRRNRRDDNAEEKRSSAAATGRSRNHDAREIEHRRNASNIDNKIIDFQKRSKYVQERLAQKRQELHEAQKSLLESPKRHSEHEQFMRDRIASSSVNESSNTNESSKLLEDNRRLEGQINVLIDIINQLVVNSPKMQERVRQIATRSPSIKVLPLLNMTDSDKPSCSPNTGRTRRESESLDHRNRVRNRSSISEKSEKFLSPLSSNSSQGQAQNVNNDVACAKKTRNAERRKKNKNKDVKSEKTELQSLVNYLNTIVSEYLGDQKKDLIEKLKFEGTTDDLAAYADTLVEAGLGRIVEEELRVNRKNNRQSFISMSNDREGLERDGIILLPVARRYAFEGDIVRAFVMNAGVANPSNSTMDEEKKKSVSSEKDNSFCLDDDETLYLNGDDVESDMENSEIDTAAIVISDNCPKSFVIQIMQNTISRQIVGIISFKSIVTLNDDKHFYKLKPHDMRMPMLYIPAETCAEHKSATDDICGLLFLAKVIETNVDGYCIGNLIQPVGKVGDLEAEIKAILFQNGLDNIKPYDQKYNDQFTATELQRTQSDMADREDLRKKCIFTIDPLTARDLDDAMSLDRVTDDEVEIGVHISDVSYYLHENTELDNIVKKRATSIYLVNEVIHMLPETLCLKCSLLPGCDKFAFSVFWRMNMEGEILGEPRFTRSIIKSCTQFAYEHAQKIIDNPTECFGADDFPDIYNGFTSIDICSRILILHSIAQKLRSKRYDNGALSINNPKMHFDLDGASGEPIAFALEDRQEANFLIEEFMLLANQSVARFIYKNFPTISILRNHAPPLSKSMKVIREKLAAHGYDFDYSSSKSIFQSMSRICSEAEDMEAMDACLNTLLTKPMARAKYICSEGIAKEQDLWHYALSIPIYTHFTSPIRRYPDILVHRILAAALNYGPVPKRKPDELHALAKICNDQKFNAKTAGDDCSNLFFKRFIKAKQSLTLRAAIVEIFQHFVNVVTIDTGHALSIHYKMQKVIIDASNVPTCIFISEKNSKQQPVKLQLFSTVEIKLVIWDEKICAFFVSPDVKQRQLNCIESSKKKQEKNKNTKNSPSNSAAYSNDDSRLQNNPSNFKLKKQRH